MAHPKMPMEMQPVLLRAAAYGTVATLPQIQRELGLSRNWTRVLSDELAEHGFLKKRFLPRAGPGRPVAGYELTKPGEKLLEAYVEADVVKFGPGVACAGPVWSLALYGLPFAGQKDAFVRGQGTLLALKEVRAPDHVLDPLGQRSGIPVPSPESLVVWLLESMEERFVLAGPHLAKTSVEDWPRLWNVAAGRGVQGRLAYALWATDQEHRIPEGLRFEGAPEPLVAYADPGPTTESRCFNVTHAVPKSRFDEFGRLYRGR